jgi:hypothetical protein
MLELEKANDLIFEDEKSPNNSSGASIRDEGNVESDGVFPEGGWWGWSTLLGACVILQFLRLMVSCEAWKY